MALIDCASWKPEGSEFVFAYRYPQTNLSTYTQLVVHESQEAFLFSKGQLMGKFGPGKHTLDTENLPLLRNLFGIPFGGKNPFTAEVWIVNKLYPTNLDWRISNINVLDTDFGAYIPLKANGQYGVNVENSEKFLIKMVGTKNVFTARDMQSQAQGEFASKSKSAIVQFMTGNNVGFMGISAHLDMLSEYIKSSITDFWKEYGLCLNKFYINEIAVDDSTPEGNKILNALANRSSQAISGHSWQQEQMFAVANNAVEQMGNAQGGNGLIAGLMAMNMIGGGNGAGLGVGMMQPHGNPGSFQPGGAQQQGYMGNMGSTPMQQNQSRPREIYCANCSKKHLTTERFCPHCGSEYNPCPNCGSDNPKNARRCVSCGTQLDGGASSCCPNCGAQLSHGAKFCPNCGAQQAVVGGNCCSRCGAVLPDGVKFCPQCGMAR